MKYLKTYENITDYEVLGTNDSHWSWEDDSDSVTAKILLNKNDNSLYLKINKQHTKHGLGAGTYKKELEYINIGDFKKPKLALVRSLLKKHGHTRSRSGSPFSTFWEDDEGNKMNLSDLIQINKPEPIKLKHIKSISKFEEPEKDIELVKYSERSYALFGEGTKKIKDKLMAIGCRYNKFLKDPKTGNKRPGWIFSINKLDKIKEIL